MLRPYPTQVPGTLEVVDGIGRPFTDYSTWRTFPCSLGKLYLFDTFYGLSLEAQDEPQRHVCELASAQHGLILKPLHMAS
jgi:hypothetical protein